MDAYFFNLINHLPHPQWADSLVLLLDFIGEKSVVLGSALLVFMAAFIFRKRKIWWASLFILLTFLLVAMTAFFLKKTIDRPRPDKVYEDVYFVGRNQSFQLMKGEGSSFPSGHASFYGAIGFFMIFYFKKYRPFWVFVIIFGGLARVYQGVHYPSDVLGGWLIAFFYSWAMSFACFCLEKKLEYT